MTKKDEPVELTLGVIDLRTVAGLQEKASGMAGEVYTWVLNLWD